MGTASSRHDLHALSHFFNRHAVNRRRALYELLDELDAIVNSVRLEALKVQRAAREVLQRHTAQYRFMEQAFMQARQPISVMTCGVIEHHGR